MTVCVCFDIRPRHGIADVSVATVLPGKPGGFLQGGFSLGPPGAIESDLDTAASFDGSTGAASAPLDLSGTSQLTVEFWLNWAAYANDESLVLIVASGPENEAKNDSGPAASKRARGFLASTRMTNHDR